MPLIDGIDIEEYHRSKLLSTSKLSDFAARGPRYFASRHVTGNSRAFDSTDSQVIGQAFEDLVSLKQEEFDAKYVIKPDGMNFSTKAGKEWREANSARTIIADDDYEGLQAMREALWENDAAMSLIRASKMQVTIRADYEGTPGIQSRPDFLCLDGGLVTGFQAATVDLKTTLTLGKLTSGRSITEYRYHCQAALGLETLQRNGIEARSYLIACEKVQPYRCQVVEITPEWLDAGWRWCERQLSKLVDHYRTGEWPRVEREVIALPPAPSWVTNAADRDDDADAA